MSLGLEKRNSEVRPESNVGDCLVIENEHADNSRNVCAVMV